MMRTVELISLDRLPEVLDSALPEDRRRVARLVGDLASAERRVAEGYLEAATHSSDEATRAWAAGTAGDVLGPDGAPLILPLLFDKSADLRNVAMSVLARVRPEALRPQVDRLVSELATRNALQVIWIFVLLKADGVAGRLREFAASVPTSDERHKLAVVAASYTEEGLPGVAAYLGNETYCGWASYLLARLGTEEAEEMARTVTVERDACRGAVAAARDHLQAFLAAGNRGFHDVEGRGFSLFPEDPSLDPSDAIRRLTTALKRLQAEQSEGR